MSKKSDIIVISWWSNCLGLACLHGLIRYVKNRRIFVIQTGKKRKQRKSFTNALPTGVIELSYPPFQFHQHWRVCEIVVNRLCSNYAGLWFFDHDLFFNQDVDPWLDWMDERFDRSSACLSYPGDVESGSITTPAFWISPQRMPDDAPGFSPKPPMKKFNARRPYAKQRNRLKLVKPAKDTLVVLMESLAKRGMVLPYMLHPGGEAPHFPDHAHIGGLHLFMNASIPGHLVDVIRSRVGAFKAFLSNCPEEWIQIEDPALLEKVRIFDYLYGMNQVE